MMVVIRGCYRAWFWAYYREEDDKHIHQQDFYILEVDRLALDMSARVFYTLVCVFEHLTASFSKLPCNLEMAVFVSGTDLISRLQHFLKRKTFSCSNKSQVSVFFFFPTLFHVTFLTHLVPFF